MFCLYVSSINCFVVVFRHQQVCSLLQAEGQGRTALQRFWFNSQKNQCETLTFGGGAGGNENNFQTIEECSRVCIQKQRENRPFKIEKFHEWKCRTLDKPIFIFSKQKT